MVTGFSLFVNILNLCTNNQHDRQRGQTRKVAK